jgi:acyl dehydratase
VIDYEKLKRWPFREIEHSYTEKDTILYALGVGLAHDPVDEAQLQFVYEKHLKALPTMAVVLGYPGFWVKDPASGVDWVKVVHGEQSLKVHKPIPAAGTVIGRTHVSAIVDKGPGKGALLVQERTIHDKRSSDLLATIEQVTFCRGDGGFSEQPGNGPKGGDPAPVPKPAKSDRAPDAVCELPTLPQSALIYRLSGDLNPLHAEPAAAVAAGYPRPILQGLCTYGVASHAVLKTYCGYEPSMLMEFSVRFSAPVFPGERIRTEMWRESDCIFFQSLVPERGVVVLSHGMARLAQ